MKISKKLLKKIIREERQKLVKEGFYPEEHGVPDAHSPEEKQLQQLKKQYPNLNDYFDGGWDEEGGRYGMGAWVVMDETEGRFVDTGVSTKGQLGKYLAWDSVNSREQRDIKANRMAAAEMGWTNESKHLSKRDIKRIIREEKAKLSAWNVFPPIEEFLREHGKMT